MEYEYKSVDLSNLPQLPCEMYNGNVLRKIARILKDVVSGELFFEEINGCIYSDCRIRVQKRHKPDDTVERFWYYYRKDYPYCIISTYAYTEKRFIAVIGDELEKYSPGDKVPATSHYWTSV